MPHDASRQYLICYDIANPRRLGRIHRHLAHHALPLQYSVFYYQASEQQLARRLQELRALMDECADDIRAYPIGARSLRLHLGTGTLPEGIHYTPLPADWREPCAPATLIQPASRWYIA